MVSSRTIATLFIAATIAMTLFNPVSTAIGDHTGTVTVTNETVTADVGNYTDLEGYDIDQGTDTVYWLNSSSGSYEQVSSPGDYELAQKNGSIKANQSGTIGDGDSLKVSYDYTATDATTTTVAAIVPLFLLLLVLVTIASKIQGGL